MDWKDTLRHTGADPRPHCARTRPRPRRVFTRFTRRALPRRPVDKSTEELIALANRVVQECNDCIASSRHGRDPPPCATRQEFAETINVCELMNPGRPPATW